MKERSLVLVLCSTSLLAALATAQSSYGIRAKEQQIIEQILDPSRYNKQIRPNGTNDTGVFSTAAGTIVYTIVRNRRRASEQFHDLDLPSQEAEDGPVVVKVNTLVRHLQINEGMDYDTQLTFRMQWTDDRLKYASPGIKNIVLTSPERIWIPDIFFSNEIQAKFHNVLMPNTLVRIYPNGEVLYSIRISLKLSCPMDLKRYPMDYQTCPLIIASYRYTTDHVILFWKEGDPVQVVQNIYLTLFQLNKFSADYCTSRTNTGVYSCVMIKFQLKRDMSYYMVRYYIPSIQLVVISWIASWLHHTRVTARVLLGLFALFSISALGKAASPAVSYTTAIDTWFSYSSFFVLLALLETVAVQMCTDDHKEFENTTKPNFLTKITSRISSKSHWLDVLSRVLFPATYILFNLIYWICLSGEGNTDF